MGRQGYDKSGLEKTFRSYAAMKEQINRIRAVRERLHEDEKSLRKTQDPFVVEMRNRLLSFSEIKRRGEFSEGETTLQTWHNQHAGHGPSGTDGLQGFQGALESTPISGQAQLQRVHDWRPWGDKSIEQAQESPFSEDVQVGLMQAARLRTDATVEELRKAQEEFLLLARQIGTQFQDIEPKGRLTECESTLRKWYLEVTSPSAG